MLNFSALVVGEKYKAYFVQMLDSLEKNCSLNNYNANVFVTSTDEFKLNKYNHLKIYTSHIEINNNSIEFQFFIKSLAISFAAKNLKDNDRLIHIDCDITFNETNILDKLNNLKNNGIYAKINLGNYLTERLWRYPVNNKLIDLKDIFPNSKIKYNLNDTDSYLQLIEWGMKGVFRDKFEKISKGLGLNIPIKRNKTAWLTYKPKISYFFYEGLLYFNINKNQLKNFCYYWYEIGEFIKNHNLRYSGEAVDISIAAYLSNIDILFYDVNKLGVKFIDFGLKDNKNYI
jgi:hypothetical protein